jgi:predicted nucleotidyltransferase component of viral defense system
VSKEKPTNVAASIRQRLLNLAHDRKEEFQFVLVRYAAERLLYRLSKSAHADQFLLKGALLFQLWTGRPHRATLDLDLLGQGDDDVARFENIFLAVCSATVEDDGLTFLTDQIRGEEIREDQRYAGVRIHGIATLGTAKITLQIDIGFGDAVTPKAQKIEYPSLLGLPTATMRAYPKETVVAEKFEAMVSLGIANSRMKDFYDIWVLSSEFEFDGDVLGRAIRATFERRGAALPVERPLAFTLEFSRDRTKTTQWQAFLSRGRLVTKPPSFESIIESVAAFLSPVVVSLHAKAAFGKKWHPGGPWR